MQPSSIAYNTQNIIVINLLECANCIQLMNITYIKLITMAEVMQIQIRYKKVPHTCLEQIRGTFVSYHYLCFFDFGVAGSSAATAL